MPNNNARPILKNHKKFNFFYKTVNAHKPNTLINTHITNLNLTNQ